MEEFSIVVIVRSDLRFNLDDPDGSVTISEMRPGRWSLYASLQLAWNRLLTHPMILENGNLRVSTIRKWTTYLIPVGGNPKIFINLQKRQESEITSGWIRGLDGSFFLAWQTLSYQRACGRAVIKFFEFVFLCLSLFSSERLRIQIKHDNKGVASWQPYPMCGDRLFTSFGESYYIEITVTKGFWSFFFRTNECRYYFVNNSYYSIFLR